mmetsp:Transcript_10572/g.33503  ORF Transcript_10572/g.33503 Transcript_10572/m.33503 type:complete len:350 (-) Transcript_10572:252-1301(-)
MYLLSVLFTAAYGQYTCTMYAYNTCTQACTDNGGLDTCTCTQSPDTGSATCLGLEQEQENEADAGLGGGTIAGIVVGSLVAVTLLGIVAYYLFTQLPLVDALPCSSIRPRRFARSSSTTGNLRGRNKRHSAKVGGSSRSTSSGDRLPSPRPTPPPNAALPNGIATPGPPHSSSSPSSSTDRVDKKGNVLASCPQCRYDRFKVGKHCPQCGFKPGAGCCPRCAASGYKGGGKFCVECGYKSTGGAPPSAPAAGGTVQSPPRRPAGAMAPGSVRPVASNAATVKADMQACPQCKMSPSGVNEGRVCRNCGYRDAGLAGITVASGMYSAAPAQPHPSAYRAEGSYNWGSVNY